MKTFSLNKFVTFVIKILNVSPFCVEKSKHEFTDIDRTCEVHLNWTNACISQYKLRKRVLFDLLTCFYSLFLFFFFSSTFLQDAQTLQCDVMLWQSESIAKSSHCEVTSFFRIFNFFLFVFRKNLNNLVSLW